MTDDSIEKGKELLDEVWFDTIDKLQIILQYESDPRVNLEAADILLRYFISLGQSINQPYIPDSDPRKEDEDD